MKIAVLGTRGFPGVQGGVEAHCENLYPRLVKQNCEVIVFTRKPYANSDVGSCHGVKLIPLECPKNKFLEAFLHTFYGIFAAKRIGCDILHIHAVGPSLFVPLARLLGLKVVMTNHGPDYERKKWGKLAKVVLKLGEYLGSKWANSIICISRSIADNISKKYHRNATVIPNGVTMPEISQDDGILKKYGLTKGKYILAVGRFVPEKGFHDLIEAFGYTRINTDEETRMDTNEETQIGTDEGWKLVIVGDADHPDRYSLSLKKMVTRINTDIKTRMDTNEETRMDTDKETRMDTDKETRIDTDKETQIDTDEETQIGTNEGWKANSQWPIANNNIVLTGRLSGKPLQELYSHAGLFVLPSYYEGLPIVLLEAMSYGLSCIVSDIPANREVELNEERYFKPGDTRILAEKIEEFIKKPFTDEKRKKQIDMAAGKYDWEKIAEKTMEVYRLALGS